MQDVLALYRRFGLVAIPLQPNSKQPAARWKQLLGLSAEEAFAAAQELFEEARRRYGDSIGIGVLCSPPLVVLDVDDMQRFSEWLRQKRYSVPPTTTVRTRRGVHFWFAAPEGYGLIRGCKRLEETGAELRGVGQYVVAPYTVIKGHMYTFLLGHELTHLGLRQPPQWVIDEFIRSQPAGCMVGSGWDSKGDLAERIAALVAGYWDEGRRHDLALGLAGLLCKRGISEETAARTIERICALTEDPERANRLEAVRDTYAKRDGIAGAAILSQHLPPNVLEQLERLLDGTGEGKRVQLVTFEEWAQMVEARTAGVWLVDGVMRQGDVVIVAGRPKAGKSVLAANLAHALATGTAWLGLSTARCGVLYLDFERERETVRRLRMLGGAEGIFSVAERVTVEDLGALKTAVAEIRERLDGLTVVVVVDTLVDFVARTLGRRRATLNDYDAVGVVLQRLRDFAAETGATLVIVHHTGKMGAGAGDERELLGSTAISAKADVLLQLYRETEAGEVRRLHISGNSVEERTLYFAIADNFAIERTEAPERTLIARAVREIRELLCAEGKLPRQDIIRHLQAVFGLEDSAAQKLFVRAAREMSAELYTERDGRRAVYGLREAG